MGRRWREAPDEGNRVTVPLNSFIPAPLIRPLAWAKLKLRFGVAWPGTFSLWEKGIRHQSPGMWARSSGGTGMP